ncbi:MAG: cysteine methyltransferase [Alteromonadaceae bacterium]|nr:cysteine methyltransferase [Alteromonadaceae bacterium]|tara:strand:- start:984 stop:1358 length:375 start_codon:yes stop_codon:yes gene_type:complete
MCDHCHSPHHLPLATKASEATAWDSPANRQQIIWSVVCQIPSGRTASYSEVARRAGLPGLARYVGRTLAQLPPGSQVPWHRVVNAQRRISFSLDSPQGQEQKLRLEAEGITVEKGRVAKRVFEG